MRPRKQAAEIRAGEFAVAAALVAVKGLPYGVAKDVLGVAMRAARFSPAAYRAKLRPTKLASSGFVLGAQLAYGYAVDRLRERTASRPLAGFAQPRVSPAVIFASRQ